MRQAGVLAACGIISLEKMTKRLCEDHANARYLAETLAATPDIILDPKAVHINLVFFTITKPNFNHNAFPQYLLEKGIKINAAENGEYRFVTHNNITRQDIDTVIDALTTLCFSY